MIDSNQSCSAGYSGDKQNWCFLITKLQKHLINFNLDVDECQFSDECKALFGNRCVNTPGSYTCDCRAPSFVLATSGSSCQGKQTRPTNAV